MRDVVFAAKVVTTWSRHIAVKSWENVLMLLVDNARC